MTSNPAWPSTEPSDLKPCQKELTTIYGVGDNPLTDIRGANNAGKPWQSVLTRTGIFHGGLNDLKDPAHMVVEERGVEGKEG